MTKPRMLRLEDGSWLAISNLLAVRVIGTTTGAPPYRLLAQSVDGSEHVVLANDDRKIVEAACDIVAGWCGG